MYSTRPLSFAALALRDAARAELKSEALNSWRLDAPCNSTFLLLFTQLHSAP
jgi:hypothetical protein